MQVIPYMTTLDENFDVYF